MKQYFNPDLQTHNSVSMSLEVNSVETNIIGFGIVGAYFKH